MVSHGYYSDLLQLATYGSIDGMVQKNIPFGDGRELFDTASKCSRPENTWSTKNFEANSFVICKALSKFMKILSHENLNSDDISLNIVSAGYNSTSDLYVK